MLIPSENEKDLKDIPNGISKELEIVTVDHMDEVLTHSLIMEKGETLFKPSDIAFDMTGKKDLDQPGALN